MSRVLCALNTFVGILTIIFEVLEKPPEGGFVDEIDVEVRAGRRVPTARGPLGPSTALQPTSPLPPPSRKSEGSLQTVRYGRTPPLPQKFWSPAALPLFTSFGGAKERTGGPSPCSFAELHRLPERQGRRTQRRVFQTQYECGRDPRLREHPARTLSEKPVTEDGCCGVLLRGLLAAALWPRFGHSIEVCWESTSNCQIALGSTC